MINKSLLIYSYIISRAKEKDNDIKRSRQKMKKEKKKITLREYHKKRMVTGIAIIATQVFENTVEHYKLDDRIWASISHG